MDRRIGIFNFDNVYLKQDFYQGEDYEWVDCSDLSGVNGYCDRDSFEVIRSRISKQISASVNFIDSGNYHYITYLLLQRIHEDFTLILFDHHTDMQPSLFEEMLSCGSWVKWALDENPYLKDVIIIGAKEELIAAIREEYLMRVHAYSEETIDHSSSWEKFAFQHVHYPVYISVDKDVIEPDEVATNWDQGVLSLEQLRQVFDIIRKTTPIIGIDVCGECDIHQSNLKELQREINQNNTANKTILNMIECEV